MRRADLPQFCSDINVTPLVDVVLVLLIIFMVVTPMLRDEAAVQPPKTDHPPTVADEPDRIVVNLASDGSIRIGDETVSGARLQERLRATAGPELDRDILIKADAGLPFGAVQRLMSAVQQAGFTNVGLVADQRNEL
jgi:biopolymer transport protein TolR